MDHGRVRRFALCALLALLPAAAPAADQRLWESSTLNQVLRRGELRIGLEAGYMPFEMRDKKGDIIGFDIDLARVMAKTMGVKLRVVNTQWDGIIPALLTDKFDLLMGGMTITSERNLQVNFCDPYIVIGQSILLARRHEGKITRHDQLNDPQYVVATKLGTTGDIAARRLFPRAKLRQYESQSEAALEARNGRVDAMIYDMPFNLVYAAQYPGALVHLAEPFTREPLAWAVRKGDPDFLNWLNNFLRVIKDDGTYDALYGKWFEKTVWLQNVIGQ